MNWYVAHCITWIIICIIYNASGSVLSPLARQFQSTSSTSTTTTTAASPTKLKGESNIMKRRQRHTCTCRSLTNHIVCYKNVTFVARHRTNPTIRYDHELEVRFVAFHKRFILVLHAERTQYKYIFQHNTTVTLIKKVGRQIVNHSFEHYFNGYLHDEPMSMFHGRYNDGILDGVIYTPVETYYIEPRQKYFSVIGRHNTHRAVVYRETDLVMSRPVTPNPRHMGIHGRDHDCWSQTFNWTLRGGSRYFNEMLARKSANISLAKTRWRRQSIRPFYTVCELSVVVDHSFFNTYCGGSVDKTVDIISFVIKLADHSFRRVDFGADRVGDNIGFMIKEVTIFTSASSPDYVLSRSTQPDEVVRTFADYDFSRSCLGVLFTHRNFDHDIVSDSFMGCASSDVCLGGICAKRVRRNNKLKSYNVLVISSVKSHVAYSRRGLATTLVHELGHTFGAGHDETQECLPTGKYGVYVMHPDYSSANKSNSFFFSPCSIRSMGPVVNSRGTCLKTYAQNSYCGNYIREPGEECDCGPDVRLCQAFDKCCLPPTKVQQGCRIARNRGYVCSPKVSPCCTDECQVETGRRECRARTECTRAVECNQKSVDCPKAEPLPDLLPCAGGARLCYHGSCSVSRCEGRGWHDCHCSGASDELCQLCCSTDNSTGSWCRPAYKLSDTDNLRQPIYRHEPGPCNGDTGYCDEKHVCVMAYPRDHDPVNTILLSSFFYQLCMLFVEYWYVILLMLELIVVVVFFVLLYWREDETARATAYRTGLRKASMTLRADLRQLDEQKEQVTIEYEKKLRRIDEHRPLDFIIGVVRLRMFFPTAPRNKVVNAALNSSSEEYAVMHLLLLGYPLRIFPNAVQDVVNKTLETDLELNIIKSFHHTVR